MTTPSDEGVTKAAVADVEKKMLLERLSNLTALMKSSQERVVGLSAQRASVARQLDSLGVDKSVMAKAAGVTRSAVYKMLEQVGK